MPLFSPQQINQYALNAALSQDKPQMQAQASGNGEGMWPYIAMAGANGADIGSSFYKEKVDGTHEGNPLSFNNSVSGLLPAKLGVMGLEMALVHKLAKTHPTLAKVAGYAASVPPVLATIHNIGVK